MVLRRPRTRPVGLASALAKIAAMRSGAASGSCGALGGLVAGITGETQLFVSGGAEHQSPDGGGLVAVIAER
jgi:hypothetical protein